MKTTFWIFLLICLFAMLFETSISFKPFKITFGAPYMGFAVLFLMFSITLFGLHYEKKGKKIGYKNCLLDIQEELKESSGNDYEIKITDKDGKEIN